jgi:putative ATP-dependent endonuclease of OLD family
VQLTSFSVSNFRSITTAKKVPLSNYSVLVGANNEGKSNILHALAIAMEALENFKHYLRRDSAGRLIRVSPSFLSRRTSYNWTQDFPISKQKTSKPDSCSEVILEFQLSNNEVAEFLNEVGSKLNGTLPIQIKFLKDEFDISIPKQGPGAAALTKKANSVVDFVSRRINFDYIPAIRTSENAERVISELVGKELSKLEVEPGYKEALQKIIDLQEPVLKALSNSIQSTVANFLPSVKGVEVTMPSETRRGALRRGVTIEIDDGNRTPLERKGDGVKSLVALALMRHASTLSSSSGSTIVAIEEPEAHLHPRAIHELRDVLASLSEKSQIIITSHSPLFVNPAKLESTIVVQASKASPARHIKEVREVLGVKLSDNLQSARLVAVVEGSDDIIILRAILEDRYPELKRALHDGDLVLDEMGGATNLSYKVRTYRASACLVQCFLDADKAGREATAKALSDGIINVADYNLINVSGLPEAELEDILNSAVYKADFIQQYGVDPSTKLPAAVGLKWSDAMKKRFEADGKIWSAKQEMELKLWMANYAAKHIKSILVDARIAPVEAFAAALIQKLKN